VWAQNRIWCWAVTYFPRARRRAFAIVDVVSRKWIATLLSPRGDLHPGAGPLQPGPRDRRPGGSPTGRARVQIPPPATNENPWSRGYRMALGQRFRLFWVFAFCSAAFGLKVESVVWV